MLAFILACPSLFLDRFIRIFIGKYASAQDVQAMIALSSGALAYYVALLLDPMTEEQGQ